ncbi:MAG: PBP1A family penicillin-binding protein [Candidatus Levybacteria bacterium]|nr:PBP1A family penicillin-binding protein [Candidatus Levybacteria bacterium]
MGNVIFKKSQKKAFSALKRRLLRISWFIFVPILVFVAAFYWFTLKDLPSPTRLKNASLGKSTRIYDRNNTLLYTVYNSRNQTFVPLAKIPKSVQEATIAVEDKDFYRHGAVDFRGIARAFYSTFFKKRIQGGSTLTQQLVKNSLLSPEQTVQRKVREVFLSFATELLYSKEQILEMYLNQVPYGGTAYGVEAAAQTYFGKPIKDITVAEAALIAGLPEAPSIYSPFGSRPELAKQRQELIIHRMRDQGYITKIEEKEAFDQEIKYQKFSNSILAPHFVLYVKELLAKRYGTKAVEQGGLTVKTSLDLPIQEYAQASVAAEVAKLKSYKVSNGAALITNPATGEILAMVGSRGYFDTKTDGNVNVTLANLQPGSSIKPINYAVGLIKGYTAASPFIDQPVCFPSPGNPPYCPKNYDGKFRGVVQMRQALANSLNIPAVQMLKFNTVEAMIATASAMGISTFKNPDQYGLSLTLGGGEVTMLDMATAFGVFANQGYRIDLHPILKVTDRHGRVLEEYKPPASPIFGKKVLPAGVAFIISHILQDNAARTEAFGANSALRIPGKTVSVKTGTTNDYRDNWTIGYTSNVLVASWVGNNDHTPMSGIVSGVTGAAPIWHVLMAHMLDGKTVAALKQPVDVVQRQVCVPTGQIAPAEGSPDRCQTRAEYLLKGVTPKSIKLERQKVFVDKGTHDLAKPGQTDNVEEKEETIMIDPLGNRYCVSCPRPTPSITP